MSRTWDLKDHNLKQHGIEDPANLTAIKVVSRMFPEQLESKFQSHARDLNAIKRRIAAAETTLSQQNPRYNSVHGFSLTAMEDETGRISTTPGATAGIAAIVADPANRLRLRAATSMWAARELCRIHLATQHEGRLQDGTMGSLENVAAELEGIALSLTGAEEQNGGGVDDEDMEGEEEFGNGGNV